MSDAPFTAVELRAEVLSEFARATDVEGITRLIQEGRDPKTARFTIEFDDGRQVRIGDVETLFSQAKLRRLLAVATGRVTKTMKPSKWDDCLAGLFAHAVDVEEIPDEAYENTVRDWLLRYTPHATTDKDGAASHGAPFLFDGSIHVSASDLARYVRREYSEQIKLTELRQALVDLGFERTTINYVRGTSENPSRSTASYYRAPLTAIQTQDGDQ